MCSGPKWQSCALNNRQEMVRSAPGPRQAWRRLTVCLVVFHVVRLHLECVHSDGSGPKKHCDALLLGRARAVVTAGSVQPRGAKEGHAQVHSNRWA